VLLDFFEESALDFEVLGDDFDDPVAVGNEGEIVVEVAGGEQTRAFGDEEGGRFGLLEAIERGEDELIAGGLGSVGRGAGRDDVEEDDGKTGVGEVSGDARPHGSCSEYGYFADLAGGGVGAGGHGADSKGRNTRTMRRILNDHSFGQAIIARDVQAADSNGFEGGE